ncbi:MAG: UDP-N-acetylmuramoyl-tripeptide--D-alanyl-D-alanine ligase [Parcubacteria group bacterium]|nr:UDP-N-acetylmuramoyl-tripeptide--D-alanyl-D-alanine ligase [Parcubacteria group bacterium]
MKVLFIHLLHTLTRRVIQKYQPTVVAITGSVGKTAAKEAVYVALKKKFKTRRSRGNFNTEIGVPLAILGIDFSPGRSPVRWAAVFLRAFSLLARRMQYPEVLVLEMGADKPGDIEELVAIAPPTIAVITGISATHTERFGDVAGVAKEKGALFRAVGSGGWIIVNRDDGEVAKLAESSRAQKVNYALSQAEGVDVFASDIHVKRSDGSETKISGMSFKVHARGSVVPVLIRDTLGTHWAYPALVAASVAGILGVNMVEAAEGLAILAFEPGRMRVLPGIKHTTIIDDTYNASLASTRAALQAVADLGHAGTVFAVLGDMLELGGLSEEEHRKVGRLVASLPEISVLITVGERARDIARGARDSGMEEERVFSFPNTQEAGLFVQRRMEKGDVVLVKGSRGMKMEAIVKEIMAEPRRANELLVH